MEYTRWTTVLKKMTVLWPDPDQLRLFAEKGVLAEALDDVAFSTTKTARPLTKRVDKDDKFVGQEEWVFKRGSSAYANDVVLPPDSLKIKSGHELLKRKAKGTGKEFAKAWLYQSYIPSLRDATVGEFRAYFVGGAFQYALETKPDEENNLKVDKVEKMYMLQRWG